MTKKARKTDPAWVDTWARLYQLESRPPPRAKPKRGPVPGPIKRKKVLVSLSAEELRSSERAAATLKRMFSSIRGVPPAKVNRSMVLGAAARMFEAQIDALESQEGVTDWPTLLARMMETTGEGG